MLDTKLKRRGLFSRRPKACSLSGPGVRAGRVGSRRGCPQVNRSSDLPHRDQHLPVGRQTDKTGRQTRLKTLPEGKLHVRVVKMFKKMSTF